MQTNYRDNYATTCGLVDEGTNANTFKITQPVSYSIEGFGYYKAATDNLAFSAGHTALGNSQRCAFFICLDASGNVTTVQSTIVTPSPSGEQRAAAEIPQLSALPGIAGRCVIGALVVTTGSSATFTPNTTDLSAAGVTFTKYNFVGDYGNTLPL